MDAEESAQQETSQGSTGPEEPADAAAAAEPSTVEAPATAAVQDGAEGSHAAVEADATEAVAADHATHLKQAVQEATDAVASAEDTTTTENATEPAMDTPQSPPEPQQQAAEASAELSPVGQHSEQHAPEAAPAAPVEHEHHALEKHPAQPAAVDADASQTTPSAVQDQWRIPSSTSAAEAPALTPAHTIETPKHTSGHSPSTHAATNSKPAAAKLEKPVQQPVIRPAAAAEAGAKNEAAAGELTTTSKATKPDKETPIERLTAPTAMRMLKTLQQTQGNKDEWHIATGVVFKSKKLDADEMSAMVDRLCVAKHADDNMPAKPHAVKLVYVDNKETYEPVKEVTKEENINYMSELYSRCQETRSKTQQQLADKYLQPLIKPREKTSSSPKKA